MTEEDIDRWERLFRHKFPKTEFGPPNEWPALIALARKGLLWEDQEQMIKEYDADNAPPPQEPQGEKCTCDDVLSPNWTPDWKCKVHDAPTPKEEEDGRNTNSGGDRGGSVDSGVSSSVPPLTPSPLVERLRGQHGSVEVSLRIQEEAAAALERMEETIRERDNEIKFLLEPEIPPCESELEFGTQPPPSETIAGLRSELKMTRDEWDYYKEQYRELAGDGMAELVERLRHTRVDALTPIYSLLNEAADALDALAGERRHLEEKVSQYFNANDKLLEAQETIATLRAERDTLHARLIKEFDEYVADKDALRSALKKILKRTDADVATMPEHDLIRFIRQICRAALGNSGGKDTLA